MDIIRYIQGHQGMTPRARAHPLFGVEALLSPYEGCLANCVYCPWAASGRIGIRTDFLHYLEKELSLLHRQIHLGLGGNGEPYCLAEKELGLARAALELVMRHSMPVQIFTRSSLIARDIDLLKEYSRRGMAAVSVSVFTADPVLTSLFEPGGAGPHESFRLLKELRKNGVMAGAVLAPVIPYITDSPAEIESVFHKVKDSGAEYILPVVLNMKSRTVRERVGKVVRQAFPERQDEFSSLYEGKSLPSSSYARSIDTLLAGLGRKYRIPVYLPAEGDIPLSPGICQEML